MARKNRRQRRADRPTKSERKRAQQLAEDVWGLPVVSGAENGDRAWGYLERFMLFEIALIDTELDQVNLDDLPPEHKYLLSRWPDAFDFFRHALWTYAETVIGMNPWTSTIRSMMVRARALDPQGFEDLEKAIEEALPRFKTQRDNVLQQVNERPAESPRERHRRMVKLYADMYEVDYPLWLIGVLGRAIRTGKINPDSFGGPKTSVAQGSLVDAVGGALTGTPLEPLLRSAYLPGLRNTIQHNSYELRLGEEGRSDELVAIHDPESKDEWPADQIFASWQSTGDLVNAAMAASASMTFDSSPAVRSKFAIHGIVSIAYGVTADGLPTAIVAQLWCFRDLDPLGEWLGSAELIIESDPDNSERVGFGPNAFMAGEEVSTGLLGQALLDRGWIRVIRVPVAPHMDMGFPVLEHPKAGEYEVVGIADEHDIPVRVFSPWPRADILGDC